MTSTKKRILILVVAFVVAAPMLFLAACNAKVSYDNENTVLVLPITNGTVTGNFNPFTVKEGNDRAMLDQVLTNLVKTNHKGAIVYGKDQNTIALDVATHYDEIANTTTATFVLKNNIKFSDGEALTLKDVMFTMYSSLSTYYVGQNTMYSLSIVGLENFRGVKTKPDEDGNWEWITEPTVNYVEGIQRITDGVTVNGNTYDKPQYSSDGVFSGEGYEAFSITIDGVDPALVYYADSPVLPMHYYGDADAKVNWGESDITAQYYGTKPNDKDFMAALMGVGKAVPMGSGPYQAANSRYEPTVNKSDFFRDGMTYFVRNEHFGENSGSDIIHKATIKKFAYRVTPPATLFEQVKKGVVHYGQSDASAGLINQINGDKNMTQASVNYWGYGYIGVNPTAVPEIEARRAIMMAMDVSSSIAYYPSGYAEQTFRSMTKESWAYPKNAREEYAYIKDNADGTVSQAEYDQVAEALVEAGYRVVGKGWDENPHGKQLNTPFGLGVAIASHPAGAMLTKGVEILNNLGQNVELSYIADSFFDKVFAGQIGVWGASWSQTADPDMYQVYHKDAVSETTNMWGYNTIFDAKNDGNPEIEAQREIINDLSQAIDDARTTNESDERAEYYGMALDYIMDLAVEMPTYQRKVISFWDNNVLDTDTFQKDVSGLVDAVISYTWNISFKK